MTDIRRLTDQEERQRIADAIQSVGFAIAESGSCAWRNTLTQRVLEELGYTGMTMRRVGMIWRVGSGKDDLIAFCGSDNRSTGKHQHIVITYSDGHGVIDLSPPDWVRETDTLYNAEVQWLAGRGEEPLPPIHFVRMPPQFLWGSRHVLFQKDRSKHGRTRTPSLGHGFLRLSPQPYESNGRPEDAAQHLLGHVMDKLKHRGGNQQ
jgi:hypothetical protein